MNYPVSDLKSVYRACDPDTPLPNGDPCYTDLSEVRGEDQNFVDVIATAMNLGLSEDDLSDTCYRQLITGHRGCGKITGAVAGRSLFCGLFRCGT